MTTVAQASTSAEISTRAARDSRYRSHIPANRANFSGAGSGFFLAQNHRMGYRDLRLNYVRCVSHFGTEQCGFIVMLKSVTT